MDVILLHIISKVIRLLLLSSVRVNHVDVIFLRIISKVDYYFSHLFMSKPCGCYSSMYNQ